MLIVTSNKHEIVTTMESTGVYHEAIALFLHTSSFQVILTNPGKAKNFSQSLELVHKTDKLDSYMLQGTEMHNMSMFLCGNQMPRI